MTSDKYKGSQALLSATGLSEMSFSFSHPALSALSQAAHTFRNLHVCAKYACECINAVKTLVAGKEPAYVSMPMHLTTYAFIHHSESPITCRVWKQERAWLEA